MKSQASEMDLTFVLCASDWKKKNTKMQSRNQKRKLLVKLSRVALVGDNNYCQCFQTFKHSVFSNIHTEVDQLHDS